MPLPFTSRGYFRGCCALSPENGNPSEEWGLTPTDRCWLKPPLCMASSLPCALSPLTPQSSTSQTGVTRTVASAPFENLLEIQITFNLRNPKLLNDDLGAYVFTKIPWYSGLNNQWYGEIYYLSIHSAFESYATQVKLLLSICDVHIY